MSGVVPVRFFTRQHLTVMWPFLLGGSYVLSKFLEFASPSALSEQDKRDSRYLKQLKFRGMVNPVFPEYTTPAAADAHGHGHGHH